MNYTSIGDQSQWFLARKQNTRLKSELQRLTNELDTGVRARPGTESTGDTSHLLGIGRSLTTLASYKTATQEAALFADTAQSALEMVGTTIGDVSSATLSVATSRNSSQLLTTSKEAESQFEAVISALNTTVAGKAVFGGTATDRAPLADADTILSAVRTAIAGATTVDDIVAAVDDWFDTPGGGFDTVAYQGSTSGTVSFRIGDGNTAELKVTAASSEVRDALKSLALGAMVQTAALSGDIESQSKLSQIAGERMLAAQTSVVERRAEIGQAQSRIENASTRNASETSALKLAKAKFSEADPYETATMLEQLQTQLETHYTLTARLSNLTLTNFL